MTLRATYQLVHLIIRVICPSQAATARALCWTSAPKPDMTKPRKVLRCCSACRGQHTAGLRVQETAVAAQRATSLDRA